MNRRECLATAGSAALGALAGCSALGSTPLSGGEVQRQGDEAVLNFHHDGERVANFATEYDHPSPGRWRLELHAWHDEATRLERLRYEIHAPTVGQRPIVSTYLQRPGGGAWPDLRFDGSADETVLAVDDLGERGEGSISFELLLTTTGPVERLPVRVFCTYGLDRPGSLSGSFEARGSIQVDLPGAADG